MIWRYRFVHRVPLRISPVAVNPFEQTQVVDLLIANDNRPDMQALVEELRQQRQHADRLVIDTRQGNNRLWEVGQLPEEPYAE